MSDPTAVEPVEPAPAPAEAPPETAAAEPDPGVAAKRARRGSVVAGALALPLMGLGLLALAVPLAVWYLGTVVRTLIVVLANAVRGLAAARTANDTLATVDAGSVSGVTIAAAIVGAVLLLAGALLSVLVLRAHGVARPALVTLLATPMGVVVAAILSASIGALGGLLFGTSTSVGEVLGKAALGISLTVIGSAVVTVVAGALVWPWVARLVRPEPVARRD
ncbi:hypothetical protein [Protaetiibacter mangrovi]|uniref:MotA/TolQ/ExbB proton channel domain-containing protein n=1 Tax=Protaetiibacter mangrovi TaxID=2970926 RepID=A0ABT1ZHH3_9MICO|nr:hypothetical protein [Protaetiibacter mangrovi]MCS0500163.1 hypothetical protein [Protaetiibacter mangrovi]TPX02495.1 hypothetical protein FJ656_22075 [Schumannella luteola]